MPAATLPDRDVIDDLFAASYSDCMGSESFGAGPRDASARRNADAVKLTPKQAAVVGHLLAGKTNKDIATALAMSPKTVEFHMKNIFKKTGATSRLELVCKLLCRHD